MFNNYNIEQITIKDLRTIMCDIKDKHIISAYCDICNEVKIELLNEYDWEWALEHYFDIDEKKVIYSYWLYCNLSDLLYLFDNDEIIKGVLNEFEHMGDLVKDCKEYLEELQKLGA